MNRNDDKDDNSPFFVYTELVLHVRARHLISFIDLTHFFFNACREKKKHYATLLMLNDSDVKCFPNWSMRDARRPDE